MRIVKKGNECGISVNLLASEQTNEEEEEEEDYNSGGKNSEGKKSAGVREGDKIQAFHWVEVPRKCGEIRRIK